MIETCEYWLRELIKEKYSLTSLIIQIMYIKISGVTNWEKFCDKLRKKSYTTIAYMMIILR